MAAVLRLVKRDNRQTVALLEGLLEMARHEEVDDVMVWYRGGPQRVEKLALAGVYRSSTGEALRAAMKTSMYLTDIEDQVRGVPT